MFEMEAKHLISNVLWYDYPVSRWNDWKRNSNKKSSDCYRIQDKALEWPCQMRKVTESMESPFNPCKRVRRDQFPYMAFRAFEILTYITTMIWPYNVISALSRFADAVRSERGELYEATGVPERDSIPACPGKPDRELDSVLQKRRVISFLIFSW